ncbi:malonyl-CoA decarboxylase [Microvirga roseola]|uniref:malonyl-CoA decarboxylase n=1 Tax=Microvirga roseola TaxID=2883126 RepID=UPI001E412D76|nr:malonyl-CoA decarboxylase [Microvirga roseola]
MMNISFFSDLLSTITERGRSLIEPLREIRPQGEQQTAAIVEMSEALLSRRGEASGVAIASRILETYASLTVGPRIAFFEALATRFGCDAPRISAAMETYQANPNERTAQELHVAAEPRRQELFRRLNLAPAGTRSLVAMREDLLAALSRRPDLAVVDADLKHLFSSWFNRGFLVVRRIDWTTSAHILEKIIRYEAVHEIRDWDDLRRRLEPSDRRCFAFFHPALNDEPLIFVEIALAQEIPAAIEPLLAADRMPLAAAQTTTAVFYSISNCQKGLQGISFGNFLIKQVAEELKRELPGLDTFVTLSPVPGFSSWLERHLAQENPAGLTPEQQDILRNSADPDWVLDPERVQAVNRALLPAAACYFLHAKKSDGKPIDPVARFHLGNGARLERLNPGGDLSPKGLRQSRSLMVNYLYDLDRIEQNHEAYANHGTVTASASVKRALRADPGRALAPAH